MATVNNIAQRILDENNYTTSDISKTNLEYLIDNAIDYINLEAGTTIADLTGDVGSKSITGSEAETVVVKTLSTLLLRAYLDRGPNATVGGLSITSVLSDPQYALFSDMVKRGIALLKVTGTGGRFIERKLLAIYSLRPTANR